MKGLNIIQDFYNKAKNQDCAWAYENVTKPTIKKLKTFKASELQELAGSIGIHIHSINNVPFKYSKQQWIELLLENCQLAV